MKRVYAGQLRPGMIVGEDVYSYSNQLVISKGVILTDTMITRLELYSVPYVKIAEPENGAVNDVSSVVTDRESLG